MKPLGDIGSFAGDCLIFAVGNSLPECVEKSDAPHVPLLKAALQDAGFKGEVG